MFLIREIYFPQAGFIANGLFWSFTSLVIAVWRMRARKVTWNDLGLRKPDNIWKTLGGTAIILAAMDRCSFAKDGIRKLSNSQADYDFLNQNEALSFENLVKIEAIGKVEIYWQYVSKK